MRPVAGRRAVRWGLGDFAWLYGPFALLGLASIGSKHQTVTLGALIFGVIIQFGYWIGGLTVLSRWKGRGSLRADFGFALDISAWWAVFLGMGVMLVGSVLVSPIAHLVGGQQTVVKDLENASGATRAALAAVALFIAPVAEELLFRGLLLRSLRRRFTPAVAIGIQAIVFAAVHPIGSPTLGDLAVVPALALMGTISGILATRRGDLSASILMHIGFNLITTTLSVF